MAEHSYKVSYLCLIFSGKVKNMNVEKLLRYSILDEWGECLLGDHPTASLSYQSYFDEDIRSITKKAEILSDTNVVKPELNVAEKSLFEFCDILARTLETVNLKQLGLKHKWLEKMSKTQILLIHDFDYEFTNDVISELKKLFGEVMDNAYLTRKTVK
ncbi:MAG: hypothetical protein ABIE03_02530 [Patescibacteria group bacterium]